MLNPLIGYYYWCKVEDVDGYVHPDPYVFRLTLKGWYGGFLKFDNIAKNYMTSTGWSTESNNESSIVTPLAEAFYGLTPEGIQIEKTNRRILNA